MKIVRTFAIILMVFTIITGVAGWVTAIAPGQSCQDSGDGCVSCVTYPAPGCMIVSTRCADGFRDTWVYCSS